MYKCITIYKKVFSFKIGKLFEQVSQQQITAINGAKMYYLNGDEKLIEYCFRSYTYMNFKKALHDINIYIKKTIIRKVNNKKVIKC